MLAKARTGMLVWRGFCFSLAIYSNFFLLFLCGFSGVHRITATWKNITGTNVKKAERKKNQPKWRKKINPSEIKWKRGVGGEINHLKWWLRSISLSASRMLTHREIPIFFSKSPPHPSVVPYGTCHAMPFESLPNLQSCRRLQREGGGWKACEQKAALGVPIQLGISNWKLC